MVFSKDLLRGKSLLRSKDAGTGSGQRTMDKKPQMKEMEELDG